MLVLLELLYSNSLKQSEQFCLGDCTSSGCILVFTRLGTGAATITCNNVAFVNRQNNNNNNYYGLIFVDIYDFNIIIASLSSIHKYKFCRYYTL